MDVDVTLKLPQKLVDQAQNAGLLTSERISAFLESELERKARVDHLFEVMDKLHAIEPPLTPEEIEAEINAAHQRSLCAAAHTR